MTVPPDPVLLLDARCVRRLWRPADALAAMHEAFASLALHAAPPPLHVEVPDGGFHAKAARFGGDGRRLVVALKFNANFPGNPARHGLPTIQGALLLCDGSDGRLLAVIDSAEVTRQRTAAATALAARHLARADSRVLALIGCGAQAEAQVQALRHVLPLQRVTLFDRQPAAAQALAGTLRALPQPIEVGIAASVAMASRDADVIVTCTPSTQPLLDDAPAGCFIAAVGADNPHKSEIAPALMARACVVVDSLAQCLVMGDLHHAVAAGAMAAAQAHAELAEVIAGRRPGRTDATQITLFDSTGIGVQDAAWAAHLLALAKAGRRGRRWSIGGDHGAVRR